MSELQKDQDAPEEQLQEGQAEGATPDTEGAAEGQIADLDQDPRFRKWKSQMDRKLAAERAERERLQQKLEEHQSKVDELALKDAGPEEQAQYYRNKVTQLQEEQRQQAQRQAQLQKASQAAYDLLDSLGLDRDTPGINWEVDPTTVEGFQEFALSVSKVASQRSGNTQERVDAKVREAKQEAVRETGAARVSTATGSPESSALRRQYQEAVQKLRGSGNYRAYADLKAKYREQGLDI